MTKVYANKDGKICIIEQDDHTIEAEVREYNLDGVGPGIFVFIEAKNSGHTYYRTWSSYESAPSLMISMAKRYSILQSV